ncbi:HupE/UreJ family protein [Streptomyces sp. NPDC047061]|uniref:HupE/UreJ family protein n=1 Tax=Streptomyces sp. NPDC047061 TaxID=3154605 RepID=UPI0034062D3F
MTTTPTTGESSRSDGLMDRPPISLWHAPRMPAGIATAVPAAPLPAAPLPAAPPAGNRWRGLVSTRNAVGHIGRTTLAFTVGHSVALAASALVRLDIPARPVAEFIAFSILVGAVHAIRPLFPGREAVVAGVFGLLLVLVTGAVLATFWTLAPHGRGNPRRSWRFAHRS